MGDDLNYKHEKTKEVMKKILISWALITSLLFSASPHVHDLGDARIIITNDIVDIHVTLPAINAIGFEHAPHTKAEKKHAELFFNQINSKPIIHMFNHSFFKLKTSNIFDGFFSPPSWPSNAP